MPQQVTTCFAITSSMRRCQIVYMLCDQIFHEHSIWYDMSQHVWVINHDQCNVIQVPRDQINGIKWEDAHVINCVNASDNMTRFDEQTPQLNRKVHRIGTTMRQTQNLWKSRVMPNACDYWSISDYIYRETREFEGFGAWMIRAYGCRIWMT